MSEQTLTTNRKKCKLLEQVTASSDAEGEPGGKSPVTCHQREAAAADVQIQILQQLQTVNKRLDNMEGEVADIKQKSASHKISSLSWTKSPHTDQDHDSDSSSDDSLVPSLSHLKSAKNIQCQVDQRLRELEDCSSPPKVKSKKLSLKEAAMLM